ncbi:hypothetical protein MMC13_002948 [Lambiella insularis]|nr:hypothetical protein [Lambiella insularis]
MSTFEAAPNSFPQCSKSAIPDPSPFTPPNTPPPGPPRAPQPTPPPTPLTPPTSPPASPPPSDTAQQKTTTALPDGVVIPAGHVAQFTETYEQLSKMSPYIFNTVPNFKGGPAGIGEESNNGQGSSPNSDMDGATLGSGDLDWDRVREKLRDLITRYIRIRGVIPTVHCAVGSWMSRGFEAEDAFFLRPEDLAV